MQNSIFHKTQSFFDKTDGQSERLSKILYLLARQQKGKSSDLGEMVQVTPVSKPKGQDINSSHVAIRRLIASGDRPYPSLRS